MSLPLRQYSDEEPYDIAESSSSSSTTWNHGTAERGTWKPEVILFGPGGIKGFLELGAAVPLEEHGFFRNASVIAGVSVGALISLLIIAGYTVREIITIAADTEIFRGIETFTLKDIINHVISHTGLVSSNAIRTKVNDLIVTKFGCIPNLYQLYIATGKILVTLAYDLDEDSSRFMSPEVTPNMSCVDAVMLSMNIPFVFHRMTHDNRTFVDGALANAYPIDYFDDGETEVLGISIRCCYTSISPTTKYIHKVIHSGMDQMRYRMIRLATDRCRHLELVSSVVDPTGLIVPTKSKADMVVEGYNAGISFIDSLRNGSYRKPVTPPCFIRREAPYYYLTHPEPKSPDEIEPV